MKKDELEHIMEDILGDAKSLLSRDGYVSPIAFMSVGKIMHIIKLNFRNKEEKEEQVLMLTTIARIQKADALIVVAESWYVTSNKPNLEIEPAKHPMKKECILLVGECEEERVTITQKFEREKGTDGDRIIFGERDYVDTFDFHPMNLGIKRVKKHDKDTLKSDIKDLKSKIKNLRSNLN